MLQHLADIVHAVAHWSASTFAAIASAAIAVWAARAGVRERSQALGRETAVAVSSTLTMWNTEALRFIELVHRLAKEDQVSADETFGDDYERLVNAGSEMDRVLKTAQLICRDYELAIRLLEAVTQLVNFTDSGLRSAATRPSETPRERLDRVARVGLESQGRFNRAVEAYLTRAFELYQAGPTRWSKTRFRWATWEGKLRLDQTAE